MVLNEMPKQSGGSSGFVAFRFQDLVAEDLLAVTGSDRVFEFLILTLFEWVVRQPCWFGQDNNICARHLLWSRRWQLKMVSVIDLIPCTFLRSRKWLKERPRKFSDWCCLAWVPPLVYFSVRDSVSPKLMGRDRAWCWCVTSRLVGNVCGRHGDQSPDWSTQTSD